MYFLLLGCQLQMPDAPDDAYAHYHLGMAYNQKGKKDLAIPHLRRFVELNPEAPEAPAVRSFLSRI